jgi:hypothetical protein
MFEKICALPGMYNVSLLTRSFDNIGMKIYLPGGHCFARVHQDENGIIFACRTHSLQLLNPVSLIRRFAGGQSYPFPRRGLSSRQP